MFAATLHCSLTWRHKLTDTEVVQISHVSSMHGAHASAESEFQSDLQTADKNDMAEVKQHAATSQVLEIPGRFRLYVSESHANLYRQVLTTAVLQEEQ